jgi:hypothetical protein
VTRQRATGFGHLHEAQHPFVHARAARSSNNDDCAALGRAVFNRPGDFLPNDRAHCCREKTEIHHCDGDFVAVEDAMPGDDGVEEARALMIFLETVLVRRHSLEPQHVNGLQVGVHFYKGIRIQQTLDSLAGRLRLMIVAPRTDTLILSQLNFGHDLSAAGAFLKNAARHFTLFTGLRLDCSFFKNCHGNYARAAVAA